MARADVGFRVWNPFDAELRVDSAGRREEIATRLPLFCKLLSDQER